MTTTTATTTTKMTAGRSMKYEFMMSLPLIISFFAALSPSLSLALSFRTRLKIIDCFQWWRNGKASLSMNFNANCGWNLNINYSSAIQFGSNNNISLSGWDMI